MSVKLTPPDRERCQCEVSTWTFMTFGPKTYYRCEAKPTTIAEERAKPYGSMSLCAEHAVECKKKLGRKITFHPLPLTPARRIRSPKL